MFGLPCLNIDEVGLIKKICIYFTYDSEILIFFIHLQFTHFIEMILEYRPTSLNYPFNKNERMKYT